MICVSLIPLNAQNQTQSQYGFNPIKYIQSSTHGTVTSFEATSHFRDYAQVSPGTTLGTKIEFTSHIDIQSLTATLYLIINNTYVPITGGDPNLGNQILLPIKDGDTRIAYIDIIFPLNYPIMNCLLNINFTDGEGRSVVSLTCALKVI